MNEYKYVTFREEEGVARLVLNRPEALNALHVDTLAEIIHALDRVRDEETVRVLLLTGAGRAFSSGADLTSGGPSKDSGSKLEDYYNPILERLFALPVPFITAVNGPAVGAGCALALAGDIVLAAREAYFLQAFVNIGLIPDAGTTWILPRQIGRARAQAMMMLGERIPAETAAQWGMVYKVVDQDALAAESQALAMRFARGPTRAYALIRQGIRYSLDHTLTETLAAERNSQRLAGVTQDFAEGVAAFRQKRPAAFTGR
ncbi:enoyl-CoA hydratase PaaG (plasmid) [Cupriavidus necator N-1]|uniref:Enoyl-CoA hydratase PaaG n=1 Tax=Cupriavidus necator (strain ATCC 43291 / DSM 13513 / CCUG 52238 / LMG 8453 / N-1) TaxID=1042878 RepID=F8GWU3_CUPNN|nr:enoyl-CoA hydratase-related protein [Cupriavidus necator]AEI81813.1 enoyl-CoA hydratase PaaG [Cupriavidus necator N-1]MDX6008144.1 enoyl-CoA hydratase-related protein [Cupriavidus necator]